jgi:hypothetical protein
VERDAGEKEKADRRKQKLTGEEKADRRKEIPKKKR